MQPHTSDSEIVLTLRAIEKHGTVRGAARELGLDKNTVTHRRDLAVQRGLTPNSPILTEVDKLRGEVKQLRRDLNGALKEADTAEAIRREIWKLAEHSATIAPWLEAHNSKGTGGEVPVTIWSDWHYGERVAKEEVGGVNEFNAEIAQARIRKLVDDTIKICDRYHPGSPGIVVCLGGDMISGDIHEELAETNDRTPHQAIFDLADLIATGLSKLADHFGHVFVPCVVGNHGRSTKRPRFKRKVYTSFEWNLYQSLEREFRHDPRVVFFIPGQTDAAFRVHGTSFLLTHGDTLGVKGGDGIIGAIGPITRGTIKLRDAELQLGKDVDYVLMGHWHQMLWLPRVIVNNCLKGYDEFARLAIRAPYSVPSQALFFVHPTRGITVKREIFLEEPGELPDTEWVSWPRIA